MDFFVFWAGNLNNRVYFGPICHKGKLPMQVLCKYYTIPMQQILKIVHFEDGAKKMKKNDIFITKNLHI